MKGYSHAVTGAAGWMAVTSTSGIALGAYEVSAAVSVAGSLLCAGAALAPDMDHHSGTIAKSLPPVTEWMAAGTETISGGHRHGTHSIIGVVAFTALAAASLLLTLEVEGRTVALGAGIYAVFLVAFALKALGISRELGSSSGSSAVKALLGSVLGPWILSLGTAGVATWYLAYTWDWLVVCIALGTFIHILGDGLTPQGVPWLWPWNPAPPRALKQAPAVGWIVRVVWQDNGYFRLPLLGTVTFDKDRGLARFFNRENLLIMAVGAYWLYLIAFEILAETQASGMLF